jgi:hypothetical protein
MNKERIRTMDSAGTGFQSYRSGEEKVHAAKIVSIEPYDGFGSGHLTVIFEDGGRSHLHAAWVQKHNPQVGGYFVVADDWASYASASEFEARYVAIDASAKTSAI